jgi:hypothetical protein
MGISRQDFGMFEYRHVGYVDLFQADALIKEKR